MGSDATLGQRGFAGPLLSFAAVIAGALLLSPCGPARVGEASSVELESLSRAEAIRKEGDLDGAEAQARALLDHRDVRVRARAEGVVARVRLKRGEAESAIAGLARAADLHREAGEPDEAVRDELALVYALLYQGHRFSEARAALSRAEALAPRTAGGMSPVRYFQGVLAYETADFRSALELLREALRDSQARGLADYRASALQMLARVVQLLGREDEAFELLRDAEQTLPEGDACARADLLANMAWFHVRSRRDRASAEASLRRSLALRDARCADETARALVLTDYAQLLLDGEEDARARDMLAKAKATARDPDGALVAAWLDLEGRLSLRSGDARGALARFDDLAAIASAGSLRVLSLRASLGRARAFEAMKRDREAGEAFERAEAILAESSLLVPADEGRAGFLGSFDEGTRAAVDFFLDRDPARAAAFARRGRSRALASLRWGERVTQLRGDERARWDEAMRAYRDGRAALEAAAGEYWKLPAEELARSIARRREAEARLTKALDERIASLFAGASPGAFAPDPPADRELVIVLSPIARGVAGFAVTAQKTAGKRLGEVDPRADPATLSAALLAPFRDEIERAERVRFIVAGPLDAIDLHALPFGDAPLLAKLPVVYGADTGPAARRETPSTAVVIANPTGDLRATRAEAEGASGALRAAGLSVRPFFGEAATYDAVRDAIEGAPLGVLHYAGHGTFGGAEGWQSRLRLAEAGELSVGDVISLRRAPSIVVLSGCETGRAASGNAVGGLGLAHAFLVVGARAVVAAARPVDDALAARIMGDLYRDATSAEALADSLDRRLREAELAARDASPGGDWSNFRLLVP